MEDIDVDLTFDKVYDTDFYHCKKQEFDEMLTPLKYQRENHREKLPFRVVGKMGKTKKTTIKVIFEKVKLNILYP